MRFPLLAARLALIAMLLGAALALSAIALVRLGTTSFATGLEIVTTSVVLETIAFGLSLIWLVAALKHNRGENKRTGLAALLGSLVLLYVPLHTAYEGFKALPIQDVTTDPEDPPSFVALAGNGARFDANAMIDYRGEHNTASYMLHEYYPDLTKPLMPIMVTKNPTAKMFWRCFNVAKRMGWRIVDFNEKDGRLEAVATSFWFGQPSDIVVRVRAAGAMGARFDMRVTSEKGVRDFGHNLALIKAYRTELNS